MPEWVKDQIEYDDLVGYLQPPVGTWDGKAYRINIDGDCHTFCYRKDYFGTGSITGRMNPPNTGKKSIRYLKMLLARQIHSLGFQRMDFGSS